MCFPARWVRWIEECISTASVNVLVNGSPSGEFRMEREIHQGDPLSPFLFLVAAEGLNALVRRATRSGTLKGATIGQDKVELSHLHYADDTIFILQGSEENVREVK